jgi:hypothetical protein
MGGTTPTWDVKLGESLDAASMACSPHARSSSVGYSAVARIASVEVVGPSRLGDAAPWRAL